MQKTKRYDDNALLKKDLFMTSVLLNRCGIIRGGTFVIMKFENKDNHVKNSSSNYGTTISTMLLSSGPSWFARHIVTCLVSLTE